MLTAMLDSEGGAVSDINVRTFEIDLMRTLFYERVRLKQLSGVIRFWQATRRGGK